MKYILTVIALLHLQLATAQVVINITSVPSNTPSGDNLYIAGSFNGWDPGNSSYKLTKMDSQFYTITLGAGSGTVEFKFTRGDWAKVECQSNGAFLPNRTFTYGNGDTLDLSIAGWDDLINGGSTNTSTALPNVSLMEDSFYIPQLDRYRKIWIYLPNDYATALNKFYPVLYMHDGQNVFDDSTSFAGEWEVDETLHQMQLDGNYGCIVIGIENGEVYRLDEYSPYYNTTYHAGGQGDEYCDFLVNTLKPYIDTHYRTLSSREFTAIAGSSMGGLISLYAAIKYQNVFSKVGIFSPAFSFDDSIFTYVNAQSKLQDVRFYFVAGRNESSDMVPDIKTMYNSLYNLGFAIDEMDTVIWNDGQHAEWFWAREFPACFLWLFVNTMVSAEALKPDSVFSISPNPAQQKIFLHSTDPMKKILVEIFDSSGKKIFSAQQNFSKGIDVSKFRNGNYFLKVTTNGKVYGKLFEVIH